MVHKLASLDPMFRGDSDGMDSLCLYFHTILRRIFAMSKKQVQRNSMGLAKCHKIGKYTNIREILITAISRSCEHTGENL